MSFGISAGRLLDLHERLRDELARMRLLADALFTRQRATAQLAPVDELADRAADLADFCHSYCGSLDRHREYQESGLFPGVQTAYPQLRPVLDRLRTAQAEIGERTGLIRLTASALSASDACVTGDLRQQLEDLSYQLESHLSDVEEHVVLLLLRSWSEGRRRQP